MMKSSSTGINYLRGCGVGLYPADCKATPGQLQNTGLKPEQVESESVNAVDALISTSARAPVVRSSRERSQMTYD